MTVGLTPSRLILFDFDGTLADSQWAIVEAMGMAFASAGLKRPAPAAVRRIVGLSLEEAVLELMNGTAGAEDKTAEAGGIAAAYRRAHLEIRTRPGHSEPLFPGVRELLAGLDRPERFLGVATGKARRGLFDSLDHHGLSHRFATLQTSDDNPSKPNPEMIYRAMDEVGVEADETVMIGDTVYDMAMAANAGVAALGVSWGYHAPDELTAAGAAHILSEPGDLVPLISKREQDER